MVQYPFVAAPRGFCAALKDRLWSVFAAPRANPKMATGQLILALSADLRAVAPADVGLRLAGAAAIGGCVAALCLDLAFGFQPVLAFGSAFLALVVKLLFAVSLGGMALRLAERLSRPSGEVGAYHPWMAFPLVVLFAISLGQLLATPFSAWVGLVMGRSALACLGWIMLSSLPPLCALLLVMRRQAPTSPAMAGAVLGVGAGSVGSAIYAFCCTETAIPFVSIWYTLGIAAVAAVGAVSGARLLRW
jgi:hypothetical protein